MPQSMQETSEIEDLRESHDVERVNNEERRINEEYKTWKKNSPLLYDIVVTHALEWPTLTVQWFPDVGAPEGKDYTVHRLLMGTHTSDNDQNYLQIANVQLPRQICSSDSTKFDDERAEFGGYGGADCKLSIKQRIPHDGEINRARYMPQKIDILATKSVMGDVFIFDRTRFPSEPAPGNNTCQPTIRLTGHSMEGYGLSWAPLKTGHLLSSSDDSLICHWDMQQMTRESSTMEPYRVFRGHSGVVGDVAWHKRNEDLFASVGDDRRLLIWDVRSPANDKPSHAVDAHDAEINTVEFNGCSDFLLATGGNDKSIRLWDLRNLRTSLHILQGHTEDIVQVSWHPFEGHVLASAGGDRRILMWDLTRIGDEQTAEDAQDGPPELLFMHAGHTNKVADFAWNANMPWAVASVAEDNIVQVWQVSRNIYSAEVDVPKSVVLE